MDKTDSELRFLFREGPPKSFDLARLGDKVLKQVLSWALVALVIWRTWNSLSQYSVLPGTCCHHLDLAGKLLHIKRGTKRAQNNFRYINVIVVYTVYNQFALG